LPAESETETVNELEVEPGAVIVVEVNSVEEVCDQVTPAHPVPELHVGAEKSDGRPEAAPMI